MTAVVVAVAIGAVLFGGAVVAAYVGTLAAKRDAYDEAASVLDASLGKFEDSLAKADRELLGVLLRSGGTRTIHTREPPEGPFEWAMARDRLLRQEYGKDYLVSSIDDVPISFLVVHPAERTRLIAALSLLRDREDSGPPTERPR